MQYIIVDTDCGTDDALALMFLASNMHKCGQILGITGVSGNIDVDTVCSNIMRVLTVCGSKHVPIYRGCDRSILNKEIPPQFHGADGLAGLATTYSTGDMKLEEEHAVTALVRLAKEYKGRITLIALGPLTNLAVAQILDSRFLSNLSELFIMGGNIYGEGNTTASAEFNFFCDPEAAHIVLHDLKCPTSILAWEPCANSYLPWEWYDKWIQTDTPKGIFAKKVSRILKEWGQEEKRQGIELCDMLLMAAALFPSIILRHETKSIDIELSGNLTRGQMIVDRRWGVNKMDKQKARLLLELDKSKLEKLFEDMLL